MSRLVFTVARGKPKYGEMAMGLGRSLSLVGDPTPRAILTDLDGFDWGRHFQHVIRPTRPRSALDKLLAFEYPELDGYDHVVSIDGDCLAFRRLEPIFEASADLPLGVQAVRATKGKWHGAEVADILPRLGVDAITKFNGGLITYRRGDEFQRLLEAMQDLEANYSETGFADFRGNASEEVCVTLALAKCAYDRYIPNERDLMSTAPGAIGKVELDILRGRCSFVSRMETVRRIEPIVFHASSMVAFVAYWKQLRALERLDAYADRHPPGYRSRAWKLWRSVNRRWLAWFWGKR